MNRPNKGAVGYCLRLVSGFPLHLLAALTAALISEALLTVQPLFLRAFIDQSQLAAARSQLWIFPAFMLAAACLAYSFDLIATSIRWLLEKALSRRLKEAYLEFGNDSRSETRQFCLRTGLSDLARLTLSLSLDFALTVARAAMIVAFLSHEDPRLGAATAAALIAALAISLRLTRLIGKTSRVFERATGSMAGASSGTAAGRRALDRIDRVDAIQFRLKSLNFFVSFCLFRLLPLTVIVRYAVGSGGSLGSVASVFLYFSMLRGPFSDLVSMIKDAHVSLSEIALFRVPLERGLATQGLLAAIPAGLVWSADPARLGRPLSAGLEEGAREYFDDMAGGAPKEERLRSLALAARERSVYLRADDDAASRFAHFKIGEDGLAHACLGAGR